MPGSDLVAALFDAASADSPMKIFLLGAAPGVAERAAANVQPRWSGVRVVGTYNPPLGFEKDHAENLRILARIANVSPDIVLVGLGAPKQELWVHQHRSQIKARVVLCAGKTIDVLAGAQQQPPVWMRELGLDWLHRVAAPAAAAGGPLCQRRLGLSPDCGPRMVAKHTPASACRPMRWRKP